MKSEKTVLTTLVIISIISFLDCFSQQHFQKFYTDRIQNARFLNDTSFFVISESEYNFFSSGNNLNNYAYFGHEIIDVLTTDDRIYVLGANTGEIVVHCLTDAENIEWTRIYPTGTFAARPVGIFPAENSGLFITGKRMIDACPLDYYEAFFFKTDSLGIPIWGKKIVNTRPIEVQINGQVDIDDGGYIFTGKTSEEDEMAFALRTDSSGNVIWALKYPEAAAFTSIMTSGNHKYYVSGYSKDNEGRNPVIVCIDKNGNFLSGVRITEDADRTKMCQQKNEFVMYFGREDEIIQKDYSTVVKFDTSFQFIWADYFPNLVLKSISMDNSGSVLTAGYYRNIETGTVILLDSSGVFGCEESISVNAYEIMMNPYEFVLMDTTWTSNAGTGFIYSTINIDSLGCNINSSTNNVFLTSDYRLFPNPAIEYLFVEVSQEELNEEYRLTIFSISGETILNQIIYTGKRNSINLGGIPAGFYLVELSSKNHQPIYSKLVIAE